jgi:hypothetical protein
MLGKSRGLLPTRDSGHALREVISVVNPAAAAAAAQLEREANRLAEMQLHYRQLPVRQRAQYRSVLERQIERVQQLQAAMIRASFVLFVSCAFNPVAERPARA